MKKIHSYMISFYGVSRVWEVCGDSVSRMESGFLAQVISRKQFSDMIRAFRANGAAKSINLIK